MYSSEPQRSELKVRLDGLLDLCFHPCTPSGVHDLAVSGILRVVAGAAIRAKPEWCAYQEEFRLATVPNKGKSIEVPGQDYVVRPLRRDWQHPVVEQIVLGPKVEDPAATAATVRENSS
jgi:hypothetical protein